MPNIAKKAIQPNRGRRMGPFTKKLVELGKGQKFVTTGDRAKLGSLAWRAGEVIFEGKRHFETHKVGKNRFEIVRSA